MQEADKWFDEIERLLKAVEIKPENLHEQFGLKREDFPHIAKIYANNICIQGKPRVYNYDETAKPLEILY